MLSVSLSEVLSLHWFTLYWGDKLYSSDERGSMLGLRDLPKHTFVREPVVWSDIHKGQLWIGSGVSMLGGETGCTPCVLEQY